MRTLLSAAILGATALLVDPAFAGDHPPPEPQKAVAAEARATPAAYRGPTAGQGYSARARRIADCLATYSNYDPKTDRIRVAPGVTRRCSL